MEVAALVQLILILGLFLEAELDFRFGWAWGLPLNLICTITFVVAVGETWSWPVAIFAAGFNVAAWSQLFRISERRTRLAWLGVADKLGLSLERSVGDDGRVEVTLLGTVNGLRVELKETTSAGEVPGSVSIEIHPVATIPRDASVLRHPPKTPAVPIGDPVFEKRFYSSGNAVHLLGVLDAHTRALLIGEELFSYWDGSSVRFGTYVSTIAPGRLHETLMRCLRLSERLCQPRAVWFKNIEEAARNDPLPQVRERCEELLERVESLGVSERPAGSYAPRDLWFFIELGPLWRIGTAERALAWIPRELDVLLECGSALSKYPALQIDCLRFWYATLRGLGVLDTLSLRALLTEHGPRGVLWGGWLALMSPRQEFHDLLANVPLEQSGAQWAVRCALAHVSGREPEEELRQLATLAGRCREQLGAATVVRMPLRLLPTPEEVAVLDRDRKRLARTYRTQGAKAALAVLRGSPLDDRVATYPDWYRKTQGIPPRREFLASYRLTPP